MEGRARGAATCQPSAPRTQPRVSSYLDAAASSITSVLEAYLSRQTQRATHDVLSGSSLRRYRDHHASWASYLGRHEVQAITAETIEDYTYWARERGHSSWTIYHACQWVASAYRWAARAGLAEALPIGTATPPIRREAESPRRRLEVEELEELCGASPSAYSRLWAALAATGMRIGEALALTWGDVDLDHIIIRSGKTRAARRTIPLPAHVDLGERGEEAEPVFRNSKGGRLTYHAARNALCRVLGRTMIDPEGVTLHSLRHTYTSHLYEAGASPAEVMALLGHTTARLALEVYAHASPSRCADLVARLPRVAS